MLISKVRTLPIFAAIWIFCNGQVAHATTLELISSVPTNNSVDVSRTDTLTLQFSVPLATWSVSRTNVTLQSAAGAQKVSLSVSGAVVSVRPLTTLLPWTNYTLNATSLMGSSGEQLAAPIALTFNTRDAAWQAPQTLDTLTSSQWNPVTRRNAKGVRFLLWQQTNASGSGDDIWAIHYLPGAAASDPVLMASFPNNYVSELNVFIDDDGNAMATWTVETAPASAHAFFRIWANRFVTGNGSGSGWGTPQTIDWESTHANESYSLLSGGNLHMAFDHAGNAIAIWQRYDCCQLHSLQNIVANRYTRMTGWSKPEVLDDSYAFLSGKIDIQMDNAGNAYASWSMDTDFHYSAPRRTIDHYTLNTGWDAPRIVSAANNWYANGDQALAASPRGEAMLMWLDDAGLKYARTDEVGNWSNPILIDSSAQQSPADMVLLNDSEAFAVFADGVKQFIPAKSLWSWTHPLLVDQGVRTGASIDAQIVADATGNALVAWTQNVNGVNRIYAKRYRANHGWFGSTLIDSGNTLGAGLEDLFLEPDGSAVAAWWQSNDGGTTDINVAQFE